MVLMMDEFFRALPSYTHICPENSYFVVNFSEMPKS